MKEQVDNAWNCKKGQKYEGLCIKGQVNTDWNCKKKMVDALRGGWTITGIL